MTLASADDVLREHLELPKDQGLVVTALDPNCSAARAGIQQNDILLKVHDLPLAKPEDFISRLKEIGEKPVALKLLRGGKVRVLDVQPVIRITLQPVQPAPTAKEFWIGATIVEIDPTLRLQLRIPHGQGLMVNEVIKDGPSEKGGLKRHDILLELDGKPLSDLAKFVGEVQAHGEKSMVLKLIREGRRDLQIAVTPERRKPTAASNQVGDWKTYAFVGVQPGAVLMDSQHITPRVNEWKSDNGGVKQLIPYYPNWNVSQELPSSVTNRLDAIDAELKELRKAVEELNKTKIIPLDK
jgi:S1-C subfamily serine protease